ncbi:uncharacterized protein LOC141847061 [Curcuma longa]|uniref:uncharacterized protein LOC141847061 n=1 Tax=Curcuma longa TaxID=136217 RepID=UPI003D9FAD47
MCRWIPPPAGEISINCDASVRNDRIGLGCIGRNHIGAVVFAVAAARRNRAGNSVVFHELEAILRGLQEALRRGFSAVRVFSDSLISVQILNGDREADSSCDHLIFQIAAAASMLRSFSFSFTYREANSPADFLSKYCHPDEFEWVFDDSMIGDYQEEFQYLLCIDAFGMFHLRQPK